jgi:hypothetical protein
MRTTKLLLPSLLAIGTFVATLPDIAEAAPRGRSSEYRGSTQQYRPGHRGARRNHVPELSVGAAAAALGLLGGGLMVMTGRRRAKRD